MGKKDETKVQDTPKKDVPVAGSKRTKAEKRRRRLLGLL